MNATSPPPTPVQHVPRGIRGRRWQRTYTGAVLRRYHAAAKVESASYIELTDLVMWSLRRYRLLKYIELGDGLMAQEAQIARLVRYRRNEFGDCCSVVH